MPTNWPEAAFRRAIIAVKPDYFSWMPEVQERYRLDMPEEDRFRVEQGVLKSLFDIQVDTKKKMDAVFKSFDDEHYLLFNSAMLYCQGIGDDHFYLNEYLDEHTSLLDFETLYDYDYRDHCFQEQTRKDEEPDYVIKPYRGTLYYCWARLRIDGAFFYADLSMAATYCIALPKKPDLTKPGSLFPMSMSMAKTTASGKGKAAFLTRN